MCVCCTVTANKMSNVPPPLARSQTTCVEIAPPPPAPPLQRSMTTCCSSYYPEPRTAPPLARSQTTACSRFECDAATTPTCPPPLPTDCSSQFPGVHRTGDYPEPPALRRTDTSADYAVLSSKMTDAEYSGWLLEDNFARLSAMEEKLRKQMSELGMIRESLYQLGKRIPPTPQPPSSPVTRQVASPHAAPAPAPASPPALDMAREFGM